MQKKLTVNFKVTQKNFNSMRNDIFNADTQFNIKGLYNNYTRSSTDYMKRSLSQLRTFVASSKPIITLTPNKTMGPGDSGSDNDKFIQIGLMPQFGSDNLQLQPYIAFTKQKKSDSHVSSYDTGPQIAVIPLTKYNAVGEAQFTIHPYIPYQMTFGFDVDQSSSSVLAEVTINNLFKNQNDPQYTRWYFAIQEDKGYTASTGSVLQTILSVPFYYYPIGLLNNSRRSASLTSVYQVSNQLPALNTWFGQIKDQQRFYRLGRWSNGTLDDDFIRTMYGTTANNSYGIRYVSQGSSKFSQVSDNLQISIDLFQVDDDSRFKNLSKQVSHYGPVGYNHLTLRQNMISQKRDGRLIRDTAQIKTDKIDKGLFVCSENNKTVRQTLTLKDLTTISWQQRIYAGMGNYYQPAVDDGSGPTNSILFHMPWVFWDANTYQLMLAPVIVGPVRRVSGSDVYNLMATHSITSRYATPMQLGISSPKASLYKYGIAYRGDSRTQFYFDNSITGLIGINQVISVDRSNYNCYRLKRVYDSAQLLLNGYPIRQVTLPSSYSGDLNCNLTFNHSINAKPSATAFVYPGLTGIRSDVNHVNLRNLGASGWRQQIQFPVQLLDFNVWSSNIYFPIAKLMNVRLSKKTGNLTLDFIGARKTITNDSNQMIFDVADEDQLFNIVYSLSAMRYSPPSSLSYNSGSRIQQYRLDIPYIIKGSQISNTQNITRYKGLKLGYPGSQYYSVTVRCRLKDDPLVYLGQTGSRDDNRMDNISQQKSFRDLYLNNSIPGSPSFKSMWRLTASGNSTLSRGYTIGMAQDIDYSYCAVTGLDYYTNIYSTLRKNFVNSASGQSQNWSGSRFTYDSASPKYIQFKIDVPARRFNGDATILQSINSVYSPYDVQFYPSILSNLYSYPASDSLSAWGFYNGTMVYRGYQNNVLYSYAAVNNSFTSDTSVSAQPVTGGMWKAIQVRSTITVPTVIVRNGLKFRFQEL